jgi:hypothetical protein
LGARAVWALLAFPLAALCEPARAVEFHELERLGSVEMAGSVVAVFCAQSLKAIDGADFSDLDCLSANLIDRVEGESFGICARGNATPK